MTSWSIQIGATLDHAPANLDAFALGREIAGDDLLSTSVNENRFSVLAAVKGGDPVADIGRFAERFVEAVSVHGYAVEGWEVVECLSPAEVERRLASASLPPMVSAAEFAELCGFSKQRVYELETERRKAADESKPHAFPAPVVPGWWLKHAAERYAATRKRTPGPRPRRENPLAARRDDSKPIIPRD